MLGNKEPNVSSAISPVSGTSLSVPSLRQAWCGDNDMVVISPQNHARYASLLEKAYEELYLPNFPPSDGDLSIEEWQESFANPKKSQTDYRISIVGKGLRDGETPEIKGLCVSMYFKDSDTACLGYVVVSPQSRTEGLGHALFKQHQSNIVETARAHGGELRGNYLVCQDPDKPVQPGDAYDPRKRLEKYVKWGGKQVHCGYRDPTALRPGASEENLTLVSFPHPATGEYASPAETVGFLRSSYKVFGGVDNPDDLVNFRRMKKLLTLSSTRNDNVAVRPVRVAAPALR